jgi:hypothetical protein
MVRPDNRDESEAQRADRNLAELLQELRVAALGIQVLFGFLLAMPFAPRFQQLSEGQRHLYIADLVLAAIATALLTGPVAYHRLVFHRNRKTRLVAASNAMAMAGLLAVGLAVTMAVLLVVSFVASGWPVPVITISVFVFIFGLWVALPIAGRR